MSIQKPIYRWAFFLLFLHCAYADDLMELRQAGCVTLPKQVVATKTNILFRCLNKNNVDIIVTLNIKTRKSTVAPDLTDVPDWKQQLYLSEKTPLQ